MFKIIICMLLSSFPMIDALIIQTNQIREVLDHIDEETYVFFDIDDTLLTSFAQIGRSNYYLFHYADVKEKGYDKETVDEICRVHWDEVQKLYPVKLMEEAVFEVVLGAQKKAIYTMGLTARGPRASPTTQIQLQSLGLDFSTSAPSFISVELPFRHLYEAGIWYVEFNEKGSSIRRWFEQLAEMPAKVVFVDDRLCHIQNMEKEMAELDIEYVGIHYFKVDETPFNLEIARIQEGFFPGFISDEEALKTELVR